MSRIGFRLPPPPPSDDGQLGDREYGQITAIAGWIGVLIERSDLDAEAILSGMKTLEGTGSARPEYLRGLRDFHRPFSAFLRVDPPDTERTE